MQSLITFFALFVHSKSLQTTTFSYTNQIQSITLKPGLYELEAYGAQGGTYKGTYTAGKGGYSYGQLLLKKTRTLYVVVGGKGENGVQYGTRDAIGGYNGGGYGYMHSDCDGSAAGGGATSISFVSGLLSSLSSKRDDILLVAGGGGGVGRSGSGGAGGGANLAGVAGVGTYNLGKGGTLTSGFAFGKGQGGTGGLTGTNSLHPGAGGGGYFGGYAGFTITSNIEQGEEGGGGGSGYANTKLLTKIKGNNGVRSENGYAQITTLKLFDIAPSNKKNKIAIHKRPTKFR